MSHDSRPPFLVLHDQTKIQLSTFSNNCLESCKVADQDQYQNIEFAPQPFGLVAGRRLLRRCAFARRGLTCATWTRILPYCAQHARALLKLEVRPSTISHAGMGLFACGKRLQQQPLAGPFDHLHNWTPSAKCDMDGTDGKTEEIEPDHVVASADESQEVVFASGDLVYYMEGEVLTNEQYEERYGSPATVPDCGKCGIRWMTS